MIRQLLQELPDLGLLCLQKHSKVSLGGKGLCDSGVSSSSCHDWSVIVTFPSHTLLFF